MDGPGDKPALFHLAKLFGEHTLSDAILHTIENLAVPQGSVLQLVEDQGFPFSADDTHRRINTRHVLRFIFASR